MSELNLKEIEAKVEEIEANFLKEVAKIRLNIRKERMKKESSQDSSLKA